LLAVGLGLLAIPPLLYLGRHLNFAGDEWTWIFERRGWSASVFFLPHNEHWSTIPLLVFKLLFLTVGLRSYMPYLAALVLVHVATAFLLFLNVRRRAGDIPAFMAMLLLLFLGRGWENILWAFQIGFVGSVLFGLLALLLLDRPGRGPLVLIGASVALIAGLMCSGVGLFFLAAIGAELGLDSARRRYLTVLAAPLLAYVAWHASFGRGSITVVSHRSPLSKESIIGLIGYVPYGVGVALGGLFGLSTDWGVLMFGAVSGLLGAWVARARRVSPQLVGPMAGLLAEFILIGLVRSQLGAFEAAAPRYIYIAAVFITLMLMPLLRPLPWRPAWLGLVGVVFLLVLANSAYMLRLSAHDRVAVIVAQDAELSTLSAVRGAPDLDQDAQVDPIIMSPVRPRLYFDAIDHLGSPLPLLKASDLKSLPAPYVDRALRALFGGALRIGGGPAAPAAACTQIDETEIRAFTVSVAGGQSITVTSTSGGSLALYLSALANLEATPTRSVLVRDGEQLSIRLPDAGSSIRWRLGLVLPYGGMATICSPT
jgi:hypothetical protein